MYVNMGGGGGGLDSLPFLSCSRTDSYLARSGSIVDVVVFIWKLGQLAQFYLYKFGNLNSIKKSF